MGAARWGRVAALGAALAGAVACSQEQEHMLTVVVPTLPLRESPNEGAPPVATVRLGAPLRGLPPRFWEDPRHWRIRLNDGRTMVASKDAVAELTGEPEKMFVSALTASRLKEPYPRGRVLERYALGAEVAVISGPPLALPGVGLVVQGGRITGYVMLEKLSSQKPEAAAVLAQAHQALQDADLPQAAAFAHAAASLDPANPDAVRLAEAAWRALGDPRAATWARKMPPPKPELPRADPDLKGGVVAFVVAPTLAARRRPSTRSSVVMLLGMNTRLVVKGTSATWARVAFEGNVRPQKLVAAPFVPPPEEPAPKPTRPAARPAPKKAPETQLYVPAGWLGPEPLDKRTLRANLKAAQETDNADEVLLVLRQMLALEPQDATALKALVPVALAAGEPALAVEAVQRLGGQAGALGGFDVQEVSWFNACRGNPARAGVYRPTDEDFVDERLLRHACVADLDEQPPCPPCEAEDSARTDVSLFERDMMAFVDGENVRGLAVQEEAEAQLRLHQDVMAHLGKAYPTRGVCHIRLRNRLNTTTQEALKMVVAQTAPGPDAPVQAAVVELPPVEAQQELEMWLEMPSPPGAACMLFNARNADAVRKRLERAADDDDAAKKLPPHRSAVKAARSCSCFND